MASAPAVRRFAGGRPDRVGRARLVDNARTDAVQHTVGDVDGVLTLGDRRLAGAESESGR